MKKIENKFILFVIGLLVIVTILSFLYYYFIYKIDRTSHFLLLEGSAIINSSPIKTNERETLNVGDTLRTLGENSFGVIEWGDGSVTRIGGNTIIEINELFVSDDGTKINLSFELLKGKTWSHIISFLGEGSFFTETFQDNTASVRGTVFDVDLTSEYINVVDHHVSLLTSEGKEILITENNPFSLASFSFIDIETFIKTIKNQAWEDLNQKYDIEYLNKLKDDITTILQNGNPFKDIDGLLSQTNLSTLSTEEKKEIYNKLLTEYQKINFVDASNEALFEKKLLIKNALLSTASGEDKKNLIQSIGYDIQSLSNGESLEKLKLIFKDTAETFSGLDTFDITDISEKVNGLSDQANQKIFDTLDSLFNK